MCILEFCTGRRPASHPNHSTTYRLTHLNANLLQQERRLLGTTAENIIHILCNTELSDTLTDRGYTTSATDYLGCLTEKTGFTRVDKWGNLRRTESGWGDWFGVIGQVCTSWHEVTQKRRSNPSHITIHARHSNTSRSTPGTVDIRGKDTPGNSSLSQNLHKTTQYIRRIWGHKKSDTST